MFDPLGLLNPFVMRGKILFRALWREKYDWGEIFAEEWQGLVMSWLSDLAILKGWVIDRIYSTILWNSGPTLVLHGFGEASEKGYRACVYLIVQCEGNFQSSLVMSRARVAYL